MKIKKKICSCCGKESVIWKNDDGNKYCKSCWMSKSSTTKPVEPRQKLAQRSDKRIEQDKIYSEKRKKFLEEHPMCQIHISGICTTYSTDVHHTYAGANRNEFYLDELTWKASCRMCHGWVHANPKQSREMNLLK
jgi:hypothetical protein